VRSLVAGEFRQAHHHQPLVVVAAAGCAWMLLCAIRQYVATGKHAPPTPTQSKLAVFGALLMIGVWMVRLCGALGGIVAP
jgi:hypothetical protein